MPPEIVVSNWPALIPVLKELRGWRFWTLHPALAKALVDLDLEAQPLGQLMDPAIQARSWQFSAQLLTALAQKGPDLNGLPPAVQACLREEVPGFLYSRLPDLAGLILCLEKLRPQALLVHNDVEPVLRAAALWARANGRPAIHVPHSVYLPTAERGLEPGDDVHDLVTASHLAVAGPYQRLWYQARGAQNVRETGLPQFDRWAAQPLDRAQANSLLGLDPSRPTCLYASSWRQDTNLLGQHDGVQEAYQAFLQAARRLVHWNILISLHPHGPAQEWHVEQARQAGLSCTITCQYLEVSLAAAQVLIAYGPGNIILEAARLRRIHLVSIEGFDQDPEVITVPAQAQAIERACQECLAGPPADSSRLIGWYMGLCDGRAWQRVARYIQEVLS